jgi:hypothetical protein
MTDTVYSKLDIAYEYLETAMRLYVEERDYFSAMHLAAAAEELFGKHLPEAQRMSSMMLKGQIALRVLNTGEENEYAAAQDKKGKEYKEAKEIILGPKNGIKHMKDDGSDATITINPIAEAREWIEHALNNFKKVRKMRGYRRHSLKSQTILEFEDYRAREDRRPLTASAETR